MAASASAQAVIPLAISGDQATGEVDLPGDIEADLTITFEDAVGLNAGALEVSASLVDPLDTSVLSRLGGLGLAASYPVLLRIEPSATSALSFSGVVTVSLYTHALTLRPDLPLSLLAAHGGGAFHDITRFEGTGSYRVEGSEGGFSEFVVVVDTRPINSVINSKFDVLQGLLNEQGSSLPVNVLAILQSRLNAARTLFQIGSTAGAITQVVAFSLFVRSQSGVTIPDVWRANDDLVDLAGLLRAGADTLRFSLNRKSAGSP